MNKTTTITFLENFCRTCMNGEVEDEKELKDLKRKTISIFNAPEDTMECRNLTIMELLMLTTPQLTIESGDMLPKTLCEDCLKRLVNAHEFQQMCIRVEEKFRQMIKEQNPLYSQNTTVDPLNDNVELTCKAINDLSNILKIEMDEPAIDAHNESLCDNNSLSEDKDPGEVKFETEESKWQDYSDSDEFSDVDSEWEVPLIVSKNRKGPKVVKNGENADFNKSLKYKDANKINLEDSNNEESKNNEQKTNEKHFVCDECGNRLSTLKSLKRHMKIHLRGVIAETDERNDTTFSNKVDINEENSSDSNNDQSKKNASGNGNKNFVCDQCGNRLSTRKSLKRHKRIHLRPLAAVKDEHKAPKNANYECKVCKKVFQQSSSLKDHMRTHTGEQPYLCSECGKSFKSLSNLKQHFLRHGTDRPYVCADCPKRFPCLSDLASHKVVHNKVKAHVCDVCGAGFTKPYLLKKHKMYHTGERNHKCDYCDMRFVLADQCRRHMRTHTGEKPYKCKYCERAFAQSNDLIKHLRGHIGDNVYRCDLCPQAFRLQTDLRSHFYTHKDDDEETKERNLQALKDEELRLQMKFGLVGSTQNIKI